MPNATIACVWWYLAFFGSVWELLQLPRLLMEISYALSLQLTTLAIPAGLQPDVEAAAARSTSTTLELDGMRWSKSLMKLQSRTEK